MLDFDAIAEAKITRKPFQFFVTPNVLCNEALATLRDNGQLETIEDEWLNDGGSVPTLSN